MEGYFDIAITGAGAVGLCAAWAALTQAEEDISVCVFEKEADLAFGTSGRNSAVVHAGFNNPVGSLKAKLCVEGSQGFERLAERLGVDYERTGKLVVGLSEEDRKTLERLKAQGDENGVRGIEVINRERIEELAPGVDGVCGLWSPETAVFDPFQYCCALGRESAEAGCRFFFGTEVTEISWQGDLWEISGKNSGGETVSVRAKAVINAAGLGSGKISAMAGAKAYEIKPCRGEYHILDRAAGALAKMPVYPLPDESKGVLGIHITPTTDGKVMIGPSAEFLNDAEDTATTEAVMSLLTKGGSEILDALGKVEIIRSFAGIRPKCDANGGDFIIEEPLPGFVNLVGIESPGMTASFPIGKLALRILGYEVGDELKPENALNGKVGQKPGSTKLAEKAAGEAETGPSGGSNEGCFGEEERLICRCEKVTEGEILKAYDEIIAVGALTTIKGLKNRTGAFMGGCQGCFCTVDTVDLLKRKRGVRPETLTYDGPGSEMFVSLLR